MIGMIEMIIRLVTSEDVCEEKGGGPEESRN